MSGGTIGQGAVYSPLSQYISDSDTSEEELHSHTHHLNNHAVTRKVILSSKVFVKELNGKSMGDYQPFGNEDVGYVSVNGAPRHHSPIRDNIQIFKSDDDPRCAPMGPVRKALFISSIAMCFITVIVFLWVLPCNWGACPDTCRKSNIKSWERILNRLELKGSISVVPGVEGRGRNLVLMGRCKVVNDTTVGDDAGSECSTATDGGIISLVGSNGAIAWWKPLHGLPREMNCSLIDVNNNGVADCLVVGAKGLMAAVDPISGTMIWHLHSAKSSLIRPSELAFPLILPDLDGDGVSELLTSCYFLNDTQFPTTPTEHNYLIFVSGRTGNILGQPYHVPKCSAIHNLQLERYLNITYTCEDGSSSKELHKRTTLNELYTMITNESILNTNSLKSLDTLKQHKLLGRTKVINGPSKTYDYAVNGRRLTLENRGRCPLHCSVSVRVIDQRPGQGNEMIWNYTAENMYAMVPATLLFSNVTLANGTILTEPISGFVLKFWQWNYVLHEDIKAESTTSSNPLFRDQLQNAIKWTKRFKRGIQPPLKHTPNTSVHLLKERVVLITFNATDMHIVNASQNDVTQLCIHVGPNAEIICQPDLAFQEQSLLIADLNQDGFQELVSYFTTYVSSGPDEMSGPWRLQSKIRAIRLEAELPKLYEAVARQ